MRSLFIILAFLTSNAQAVQEPLVRNFQDKDIKWGPCPELFPKGCQIGVLQGSPEKKNTDIYFRVPGNYSIPAHSHSSAEHMTLVSGELKVRYKDRAPATLTTGTYAYGPAKHVHEAKCLSKEDCVLFISFDEPIDAIPYKGAL